MDGDLPTVNAQAKARPVSNDCCHRGRGSLDRLARIGVIGCCSPMVGCNGPRRLAAALPLPLLLKKHPPDSDVLLDGNHAHTNPSALIQTVDALFSVSGASWCLDHNRTIQYIQTYAASGSTAADALQSPDTLVGSDSTSPARSTSRRRLCRIVSMRPSMPSQPVHCSGNSSTTTSACTGSPPSPPRLATTIPCSPPSISKNGGCRWSRYCLKVSSRPHIEHGYVVSIKSDKKCLEQ